jgi:hypothetical protein
MQAIIVTSNSRDTPICTAEEICVACQTDDQCVAVGRSDRCCAGQCHTGLC